MGLDDSNLASDWRERLAKELADKGIKITKLSTDLGKHRDYVGNVLRGKANPNLGFLINLFRETGIDIFSVIRDESGMAVENTVPVGTPLETRLDDLVDQLEESTILEFYSHIEQTEIEHTRPVRRNISDIKNSRMAELAHAVLEECGPLGYTIVTGLPAQPSIYTTNPEEWGAVYVTEKLASCDPALAFMNNGSGYASWDQLWAGDVDQTVREKAKGFGLVNGSVVTTARRGVKIAVSLSHEQSELGLDQISRVQNALTTFLILMESPSDTLQPYELLYYYANGLKNEQIRNIYGLTPRKLAELKKSAIQNLNANNLEHAVAIGCKIGIL